MNPTPEFSRRVLLSRIGSEPYRQEITADAAERAALAERFELLSLDRLTATVSVSRRGIDMFLLEAAFEAEFVQACVVTLDPVPGALSEEFGLLYGPLAAEGTAAGVVNDAVAFEPLEGDLIDIGEAVAQEFSLALPPFPRSPAADQAAAAEAPDETGPFAALARLRNPPHNEC